MSAILFQYHKVAPTTWVYLSSLLTIGLFFKFSRLWSVRNLDLIGLILFAPGLLLVSNIIPANDPQIQQMGYIWLLVMSLIFMIRLLLDPMMVRRPLLEPNLSVGGMTFIGTSLLVFLMANIVNSKPEPDDLAGAKQASEMQARKIAPSNDEHLEAHGPGYPLLYLVPIIPTQLLFADDPAQPQEHGVGWIAAARTMAILSHLAVVIGMVVIGYRHFDNIKTGIAAATLYLMLPYTAQFTGRVLHALPAALLVWAIQSYRRPLVAGLFMGLAIGVIYYPLFLLPLWLAFYWHRGLLRFIIGVSSTLAALVGSLAFTSDTPQAFWQQVRQMFGLSDFNSQRFEGFWASDFIDPVYRIPVLAAFLVLCCTLILWPAQKNLGTLMSCSAAVMLGTQFWHVRGGGLYMAWYLPLMLLTIFRPNLEDRVALSVLGEGWFPRRRAVVGRGERAA